MAQVHVSYILYIRKKCACLSCAPLQPHDYSLPDPVHGFLVAVAISSGKISRSDRLKSAPPQAISLPSTL